MAINQGTDIRAKLARKRLDEAVFLYRVAWVQNHTRWLSNPMTWSRAVAEVRDIEARYPGVGLVVVGRA